jgi:hypothetical protein
MFGKHLLPDWSRIRGDVCQYSAHMNESRRQAALPYQSAGSRCSQHSDPRQKSRGFERMDALPLSICLGKLTWANPPLTRWTKPPTWPRARNASTRAARTFTLPSATRHAKLVPFKDGIVELRQKGASLRLIRELLATVGVAVGTDTIARFLAKVNGDPALH